MKVLRGPNLPCFLWDVEAQSWIPALEPDTFCLEGFDGIVFFTHKEIVTSPRVTMLPLGTDGTGQIICVTERSTGTLLSIGSQKGFENRDDAELAIAGAMERVGVDVFKAAIAKALKEVTPLPEGVTS